MSAYRDLQQRSNAVPDATLMCEVCGVPMRDQQQLWVHAEIQHTPHFAPRNEINRKDLPALRREFMDKLVRTPTGGWAWKDSNNKMQYSQSSIELVNAVFEFLGGEDE